VKKTGSRIVFVFPRLGFVVKVARIRLWSGLKSLRGFYKFGYFWKGLLLCSEDAFGSPRRFWFKGIRDNWMERSFYKSSPCREFLQPTVFSLLGLVNIQIWGRILSQEEFDSARLLPRFYDLTEGKVHEDVHHFTEGHNFCAVDGKLKMVDYGSPKTREVVSKWGEVFILEIRLPEMESKK
jgi:hypothetical protein